MKKIILLAIFTLVLLAPLVVSAQAATLQGFNPCWLETSCTDNGGIWGKSTIDDSDLKISGAKLDGGKSAACVPIDNQPTAKCYSKPGRIDLQVPLPTEGGQVSSVSGIAEYLSIFYRFFVAMIAIMAVVMVMWGGFKLLFRGGSASAVTDAKETILGAIAALVIALLSYSLLQLVNPRLVDFGVLTFEKIKTQTFGDWCGEDVMNNGVKIQCGVLFRDPNAGYTCRGQICDPNLGGAEVGDGCYQVKYDIEDKNGPVVYGCQQKWEACNLINSDNIEKFHGQADTYIGNRPIWKRACEQYSDTSGQCSYVPSSNAILSNIGKCIYTSNSDKTSFCNSRPYDPTKPCASYFTNYDPGQVNDSLSKQKEWMACYSDWCKLGCGIDINTNSSWTCVAK